MEDMGDLRKPLEFSEILKK